MDTGKRNKETETSGETLMALKLSLLHIQFQVPGLEFCSVFDGPASRGGSGEGRADRGELSLNIYPRIPPPMTSCHMLT